MCKQTLLSTLFVLYCGICSYGQDPSKPKLPIDSARTIQEIKVHGTKKKAQAAWTAMPVDEVDKEYIHRYLGGSLMQTLSRIPGVQSLRIGSAQSKPIIRGLGLNRVVVIDNEVKHQGQSWGSSHGLEIDQLHIGHVAIVKGPSSVIYGSEALAGAVEINSLVPLDSVGWTGEAGLLNKTVNNLYGMYFNSKYRKSIYNAQVQLSYQYYGDYKTASDSVDIYSYRLPLYKRRIRNTAGREYAMAVAGGIDKQNWQSSLSLSTVYMKSGFFANAQGLEPRNVDLAAFDRSSTDIMHPYQAVSHVKIANRTQVQLKDYSLSLVTAYQRNLIQERNQYTQHGVMPPALPAVFADKLDLERQQEMNTFSSTLALHTVAHRHDLKIGMGTTYQDNTIDGWEFITPAFSQLNYGLYAVDAYTSRNLTITGALRYDYTRLHTAAYTDWYETAVNDKDRRYVERASPIKKYYHSISGGLGMSYQLADWRFTAHAGRSFRVPMAKELAANGINYHYFSYEKGDASLRPEISYQWDAGVQYSRDALTLKVSPFYNYFSNYIYLNPTSGYDYKYGAGNQVFVYTEASVKRYGGEVDITYAFDKQWKAQVAYEYVRSVQMDGVKKGFTLPFSPSPSLLLNASYEPTFRSSRFTQPYIAVDYRYIWRQDHIVPPELPTPPAQLVDIQVGFQWRLYRRPLAISVQMQNVFNTKYFNHTSFYRVINVSEPGRNIVVNLRLPLLFKKL